MDRKQFWVEVVPQEIKSHIKNGLIAGTISAVLTTIVGLILNPAVLIDAILIVFFLLGIHFFKSRVCAILLLSHYAFSQLINFISGVGRASSLFMLIIFITAYTCCVIATFRYHKLKKSYETGDFYPGEATLEELMKTKPSLLD